MEHAGGRAADEQVRGDIAVQQLAGGQLIDHGHGGIGGIILDQIPEIEVLHLEKSYGFFKTLSEKEQEEVREMYGRLWNTILGKISTGDYDMLVIDEFMAAYRYGLIPNKEAVQFLKDRPDNLEVVLTGRDPSDELLELADYISEVKMVRHPFEKGIRARKGIEY